MRAALGALLLLALPAAGQTDDELRFLYQRQKALCLAECAERHYEIGKWAWENGLRAESSVRLLYSAEISDDRYKPTNRALAKMRDLDEGWDEVEPRSRTTLRTYGKKVAQALVRDERAHFELAKWCRMKKLEDEALDAYRRVVERTGDALEPDRKGELKLAGGRIPAEYVERLLAESIEIDGHRYLRDEGLARIPSIESIAEVTEEGLRVRGTLTREELADALALGRALLALLADELGARPTERLDLLLFAQRAEYEAWLDGVGLGAHRQTAGFADWKERAAAVCAEGLDESARDALVLHELTHLFQYATSRGVVPDWYSEGLAERFGGQGTFTWDGEMLAVGGVLAEQRLAYLREREERFSLRELLDVDMLSLWSAGDRAAVRRAYAQAWALVRWFEEAADKELALRFDRWQAMCSGAALGAEIGDPRSRNAVPARELFFELFGEELDRIEAEYTAYLDEL